MAGQPGFFDGDERLKALSAAGDRRNGWRQVIDFEVLRGDLERALSRSDRSKGGRPPYDPMLMCSGASPAQVFYPGRLARRHAARVRYRVVEAAAARGSAARPGSPWEGPARPHRDPRKSGGAARGRGLWTHRGERLPDATPAPQPTDQGKCRLMDLKLARQCHHHSAHPRLLQKSRATNAALARELGIHSRTVARWKARHDVTDRSTRPHRLNTSLTQWEEALVVELRRSLALPLDDIVEAMRRCLNPELSRSAIHRCLQRHAISARLTPEKAPAVAFHTGTPAGFIHIDVKYLPPLNRRRSYAYVAIDRATRFVYLEILPDRRADTAAAFLQRFLDQLPAHRPHHPHR